MTVTLPFPYSLPRNGFTITNSGIAIKVYLECIFPDVFIAYLGLTHRGQPGLDILGKRETPETIALWSGIYLRRLDVEHGGQRVVFIQETYTLKTMGVYQVQAGRTEITVTRDLSLHMRPEPIYGFNRPPYTEPAAGNSSLGPCKVSQAYLTARTPGIVGFHGTVMLTHTELPQQILLTLGFEANCNPIRLLHSVLNSPKSNIRRLATLQVFAHATPAVQMLNAFESVMTAALKVDLNPSQSRTGLWRGSRYNAFSQGHNVFAFPPGVQYPFIPKPEGYNVEISVQFPERRWRPRGMLETNIWSMPDGMTCTNQNLYREYVFEQRPTSVR